MLRLLKLLVLCTAAQAVVFDYSSFAELYSRERKIRFNQLNLTKIEGDGLKINYLTGQIPVLSEFTNKNTKVGYRLREKNGNRYERIKDIPDDAVPVCDYFLGFFKNYTLPMTRNHNDFPTLLTECDIKPRTYNLYEVDDIKTLSVPSGLKPKEYYIEVMFLDEMYFGIGGYNATFTSIDL